MDVNFTCTTGGDGYWSNVKKNVTITLLDLSIPNYPDDPNEWLELMAYFDNNDWNVYKDGLIYTDMAFFKQFLDELDKLGIDTSELNYSEQGMQSDKYISFDIGPKGISSWYKVNRERAPTNMLR